MSTKCHCDNWSTIFWSNAESWKVRFHQCLLWTMSAPPRGLIASLSILWCRVSLGRMSLCSVSWRLKNSSQKVYKYNCQNLPRLGFNHWQKNSKISLIFKHSVLATVLAIIIILSYNVCYINILLRSKGSSCSTDSLHSNGFWRGQKVSEKKVFFVVL